METVNHWAEFETLAAPNLKRGCQAIVSGLAYRGDTGWSALALSVILAPEGFVDGLTGARLVDLHGFRAFRGLVSGEHVPALLAGVHSGLVARRALPECVEFDLQLRRKDGRPFDFCSPRFFKRSTGFVSYEFPHELVVGYGDPIASFLPVGALSRLSDALPGAETPFSSVSRLAADLDLDASLAESDSTFVNVLSPYWLGWEKLDRDVAAGTLTLRLVSYWRDVEDDVALSIIPRDPGVAWRLKSTLRDSVWTRTERNGAWLFDAQLSVSAAFPSSELFLSLGGRRIEEIKVGFGPARVIAHALFDPEFGLLRKRLSSPKNTDAFEEGVAWLLHLCGFSAARYGLKDVQGSTDVVAFHGEAMAVFAECTGRLPTAEKILDLRTRADAFQRTMDDVHGRRLGLVRAILMPVPRAQFSEELIDRAYRDRVVLLGREDMEALLDGASRGEDAARAWAFIATRGPRCGPTYIA